MKDSRFCSFKSKNNCKASINIVGADYVSTMEETLFGAFHNALDWREQEMIEYPTNSLMSFTSAAMTQAPSFKLVPPPLGFVFVNKRPY